jgi:hypothetical protein
MTNDKQNLFLLIEPHGMSYELPSGNVTAMSEFFTLTFSGGEAVGLFLSRVDAEICRQLLNLQCSNGRKNNYQLVLAEGHWFDQFKKVGNNPKCHLVTSFLLDEKNRMLAMSGGTFSLLHVGINSEDMQWLLLGGNKPGDDILSYVQERFACMGEPQYIEELNALNNLDERSLARLASRAVLEIGTSMSTEHAGIPVIFSPRRHRWVELALGGRHG